MGHANGSFPMGQSGRLRRRLRSGWVAPAERGAAPAGCKRPTPPPPCRTDGRQARRCPTFDFMPGVRRTKGMAAHGGEEWAVNADAREPGRAAYRRRVPDSMAIGGRKARGHARPYCSALRKGCYGRRQLGLHGGNGTPCGGTTTAPRWARCPRTGTAPYSLAASGVHAKRPAAPAQRALNRQRPSSSGAAIGHIRRRRRASSSEHAGPGGDPRGPGLTSPATLTAFNQSLRRGPRPGLHRPRTLNKYIDQSD